MKKETFDDLTVGDIVKLYGIGRNYIITEDLGDRKTATAIQVITITLGSSAQWELAYKANYEEALPEPTP